MWFASIVTSIYISKHSVNKLATNELNSLTKDNRVHILVVEGSVHYLVTCLKSYKYMGRSKIWGRFFQQFFGISKSNYCSFRLRYVVMWNKEDRVFWSILSHFRSRWSGLLMQSLLVPCVRRLWWFRFTYVRAFVKYICRLKIYI